MNEYNDVENAMSLLLPNWFCAEFVLTAFLNQNWLDLINDVRQIYRWPTLFDPMSYSKLRFRRSECNNLIRSRVGNNAYNFLWGTNPIIYDLCTLFGCLTKSHSYYSSFVATVNRFHCFLALVLNMAVHFSIPSWCMHTKRLPRTYYPHEKLRSLFIRAYYY